MMEMELLILFKSIYYIIFKTILLVLGGYFLFQPIRWESPESWVGVYRFMVCMALIHLLP